MEIFQELEQLLRIFWYIAIPTSCIFIVQGIMTFVGVDSHEGVVADFESNLEHGEATPQVFSFRNLINFLLGFSWTGISFYDSIENSTVLIIIALIVGVAFVALFFFIMRKIQQLAETNNFELPQTINQTGEVYLTIPENKSGVGKIMISIRGSFHELSAVTAGETLKTGAPIRVVALESETLVLVEKL